MVSEHYKEGVYSAIVYSEKAYVRPSRKMKNKLYLPGGAYVKADLTPQRWPIGQFNCTSDHRAALPIRCCLQFKSLHKLHCEPGAAAVRDVTGLKRQSRPPPEQPIRGGLEQRSPDVSHLQRGASWRCEGEGRGRAKFGHQDRCAPLMSPHR